MSKSIYATPEEAEAAFYRAFESTDLEAMMRVWYRDEAIVCIHPGGPRLEGPEEVRSGWKAVFDSGQRLRFSLRDQIRTRDALLSIHLVKEYVHVSGVLRGVVLATNVYQQVGGGWYMILHHASPEPVSQVERLESEAVH
ncbi:MAG TPA: DUF4440 domain-containing protein [Chromatiales bacterium]|nr:DUF4440 domain-containing protein [Chromatiales bacterium]